MGRRILVVADSFYPTVGGAERVIQESSEALRRLGHEVSILTGTQEPNLPSREIRHGLQVTRYRVSGKNTLHLSVTGILNATRAVRQILKREGPYDLIHSHNVFAPNGVLLSREARALPWVSTFHGPVHREFAVTDASRTFPGRSMRSIVQPGFMWLYSHWLRFLQARALRAGPCVVLSSYSASLVKEVAPGYPSDRLHRIPGGVDLRRFCPSEDRHALRRVLGLPQDGPLLLTIRRLVPGMGVERLVEALTEVRSRYPQVHLVVGGPGPLREALREQVRTLGLEGSVSFPGLLRDDLLRSYYQSADLFINSSVSWPKSGGWTHESFGLVTLEALACGTPVVATRVGGSVEILGPLGEEFLVEEPTPPHLAKGILRFLDQWMGDPRIRERCRSFVADRYSWELTARRLETLYDEITSPNGLR